MKRLTPILLSFVACAAIHAQERGIINNGKSPGAHLRSINLGDCQWTDGFWAQQFELCRDVMVPHMGDILEGDIGHGFNNFKIAAGLKEGKHEGFPWHDGDFYKWMEASMYVYAQTGDESIVEHLDKIIEVIAKAQREDGYLETFNQITGIDPFVNRRYHELYNCGHLYTTASIHYRVTGKRNFLDIAIRNADHLYKTFHPLPERLARFGFNQTQIMGLVELYRTTGDKKYLELAQQFVDMRGHAPGFKNPDTRYCDSTVRPTMIGDMVQERTPLREEDEAVGHAVLALYYYAGAADVATETQEKAIVDALDRIWNNIVEKKMYVTGACGQAHHGASSQSDGASDFVHEAFIDDYMMPNSTAYNETCANIANAMFSYRMLGLHGEAKYADVMELVMYNSALSGISLDGTLYRYTNPLRVVAGARDYEKLSTESMDRLPYLNCFCCPPNLVRSVAKISGWAYSLAENGVAVNLYGGNRLNTHLLDGSALRLTQATNYPWDGRIEITIDECKDGAFDVMLRIPGWAESATVRVNGKDAGAKVVPGKYAVINREWKAGDVIALDLPMEPQLLTGNPLIEEVRNQAAIKRGPVVYCAETPDLPKGSSILDVYLPSDVHLEPVHERNLLGGVTTLHGRVMLREDTREAMYNRLGPVAWRSADIRFVPYYAWGNRGTAEMTVWMPLVWK